LLHAGGDGKLADAYSNMINLVNEETRIVSNTILKIEQRIDNNVKLGIDIALSSADTAGRTEMLLLEERGKLELDRKSDDAKFEILKSMIEGLPGKLQQREL
jgi:hypothetical protein